MSQGLIRLFEMGALNVDLGCVGALLVALVILVFLLVFVVAKGVLAFLNFIV